MDAAHLVYDKRQIVPAELHHHRLILVVMWPAVIQIESGQHQKDTSQKSVKNNSFKL